MTSDNARQLLDKFYNGTSTPADIEQLKSFFATATDIPDDMMADAIIFAGSENSASTPLPDISDIIGNDLLAEIDSAVADEKTKTPTPIKVRRFRPGYIWYAAAAACLLLVLTFAIILPDNNLSRQAPPTEASDTVASKSESAITDTVTVEALKPAPPVKAENMAKAHTPAQTPGARIKNNALAPSATNYEYDEITDPELARETLENTYSIVRESFARVNRNMPDISDVVERNNTIVSKSLSNFKQL